MGWGGGSQNNPVPLEAFPWSAVLKVSEGSLGSCREGNQPSGTVKLFLVGAADSAPSRSLRGKESKTSNG